MMNNYEKIKAMSVEEMANFLDDYANDCCSHCTFHNTGCEAEHCIQGQIKWLQQEAE